MSISSHHDAANITGNDGVGKLSVIASSSGTMGGQLMATMMGNGGTLLNALRSRVCASRQAMHDSQNVHVHIARAR